MHSVKCRIQLHYFDLTVSAQGSVAESGSHSELLANPSSLYSGLISTPIQLQFCSCNPEEFALAIQNIHLNLCTAEWGGPYTYENWELGAVTVDV